MGAANGTRGCGRRWLRCKSLLLWKGGDKADRLIVEFNSRLLPGIPWQMLGNEGAALLSGDGSAAHISALALEGTMLVEREG